MSCGPRDQASVRASQPSLVSSVGNEFLFAGRLGLAIVARTDRSEREVPQHHVFLVHSFITDLVARRVVAIERLEPSRVVLLTARGFAAASSGLRQMRVRWPFQGTTAVDWRRFLEARGEVRAVDRLLAEVTGGGSFHLYTPQTMESLAQVLKNSRQCSGFSFLEEGLNSYCTRPEIDRTHGQTRPRLRDRLAFRHRVRSARFFDPGHSKAYGVTSDSFPDLPNRVVLDDVFPLLAASELTDVDAVLAFDALSVHRRVKLASVLEALGRLMDRFRAEGTERVHYKLHPAQIGTDEVPAIERTLCETAGRIEMRRLPDTVCLEALAHARPEIRYYVNVSSVGLYAALAGCQAFSYGRWVVQAEPRFAAYLDQVPRVFTESVQLLGDDRFAAVA